MAAHDFEPGLDQRTPRRVCYRHGPLLGGGLWFLRLFILPHTVTGVALVFVTIFAVVLHLGVLFVGTDVQGRVVGKTEEFGENQMEYRLEYAFPLDGDHYRSRVRVDETEYRAAVVGDPISVRTLRCLPEYAHWPRVGSYFPAQEVGGLLLFTLVWNGILSVFVWRLYLRPWRHWRLVRYGRPVRAIVRHVDQCSSERPGAVRARYEYQIPPGDKATRIVTGWMAGSGLQTDGIDVGSVVTVLYLPWRPRQHLVYRLAAYWALAARV